MRMVKLESPNEEDFLSIWVNRDLVECIRVADPGFPGCSFVYLSGNDDPFVAKGAPEDVVKLLRDAT